MMRYDDIGMTAQTLVSVLFLVLNLCQYSYLILLFYHRRNCEGYCNIPMTVLVFSVLPFISDARHRAGNLIGRCPILCLLIPCVLLSIHTILGICREIRLGKRILTRESVKEAVDTLPAGIVYFTRRGLPILCNARMQELFWGMTGRDLQMQSELEGVLDEHCTMQKTDENRVRWLYRFADGSCWKFQRSSENIEDLGNCVLFVATDLTELYQVRSEIEDGNEQLQEMIQRVKNITANTADITRQQEILDAKMRVHNKMGNCLLSARQYLMQEQPGQTKEELTALWRESLSELQGEVGAEDEPDAYEMVVKIAESIGLKILQHGEFPENEELRYLIVVALRECVTNALHHAEASRLDLTIERSGGKMTVFFTNDGKAPEKEIVEGGGLSSLRERIRAGGGRMYVDSLPKFCLRIELPDIDGMDTEGKR
ncbi:MAG: hypothetical protein Q4B01_09030 [Eubacteriales bacterium]|nr:hypothetical protein [Eubacteriales bacterium]